MVSLGGCVAGLSRLPSPPGVMLTACVLAVVTPVGAQELEPRAYSASPAGAVYFVASVTRSSGTVIVDSAAPVADIRATHRIATLGVGYTFGVFDKIALLTAILPYARADVRGRIGGETRTVSPSGFADARLKLAVNLRGNPPMGAREFASTSRRTIVGTSVTVSGPTGQYDRTKLINIGTNRWSLKPDAGISVPVGRWDIDAYAGVWLFAINDEFFPGTFTRLQEPLFTTQGHVSYTIRPRLWIGLNGTWYAGGESRIEGRNPGPRMNNSRAGVTLSVPVGSQYSIKIAYSAGAVVRAGPNFSTVSVGWQTVWLTRR